MEPNFDKREEHVNETKNQVKEKIHGTAKKVKRKLQKVLMLVGALSLLVAVFFLAFNYAVSKKVEEELAKRENDVTIIDIHLEEKLEAIGELSTYLFEYTNMKTISDSREIWGKSIPGTKNEIEIVYSGVIKVGYEVSDIKCDVDNSKQLIFVTIPEIKVFDNYVKLDDLQCKESNNFFNPIVTSEVLSYFEGIEQEELAIAEEKGIYEKAERQLKDIIKALFEAFEGYDVVFDK